MLLQLGLPFSLTDLVYPLDRGASRTAASARSGRISVEASAPSVVVTVTAYGGGALVPVLSPAKSGAWCLLVDGFLAQTSVSTALLAQAPVSSPALPASSDTTSAPRLLFNQDVTTIITSIAVIVGWRPLTFAGLLQFILVTPLDFFLL